MQASVRALLHQIVDYAGLFPPAKLPLEPALDSYLRDRTLSPQRWMLGRFVCPAARLAELQALTGARSDRSLLSLSVLGQQSASADEFLPQLRADLEAIDQFRRRWDRDDAIAVLEVALPKGVTIAQLQRALPYLPELMGEAKLAAFLEVPQGASWTLAVAELAEVLHELQHTQPHGRIGMKLRAGGLTSEAFPSDAQVAHFLARCRDAHLPWKATAGLHHPRRHWDASLNTWHHGFLNVFLAGIFAARHDLSEPDIVSLLSDRELLALRCEEDRITYRDWSCTTERIAELRADFATGFGSCSFAEPSADLATMGLIDVS